MKILHITAVMDPKTGGVSEAIKTIIKGLSEKGIENEVACLDEPGAPFIINSPFKIYGLGPGKSPWQYSPKMLAWLKQNIARYDTIVTHGLWQYHTYAAYKAWATAKVKKPQLFVMPHGMLDPYFQKAKGRKLKAIRNWVFWKLIEGRIINNADGILFTCETEKLLAREPFKPYSPKKELVVGLGTLPPPPFDTSMARTFSAKLSARPDKYWLFLSRIHEKKGIDLLVKAYLQLSKENKDLPALIIVGPGLETEYGRHIQELASGASISFAGMLTGDAKWGAFYGCELFILPSHQENYGIAVVEAMACGKPVLISDQVNIWREIVEAKGGMVSTDTETGVYEMLNRWIALTETQQQKTGQHAKAAFENFFSIPKASELFSSAIGYDTTF